MGGGREGGGAATHPEALGLQSKPQLEGVSGEGHEVARGVAARGGVQVHATRALQQGAELVGLGEVAGLLLQPAEALREALQAGGAPLPQGAPRDGVPDGVEGCRPQQGSPSSCRVWLQCSPQT